MISDGGNNAVIQKNAEDVISSEGGEGGGGEKTMKINELKSIVFEMSNRMK